MTNPAPIASGTYFISCQRTSTFITLDNAKKGTNLTAWQFDGGTHQQWLISLASGSHYVLRNAKYGAYISFNQSNSTIFGGSTPSLWLIQDYKGGFIISAPNTPTHGFNLASNLSANATLLLIRPFEVTVGPDNQVWYFNSTTPTTLAAHPTKSTTVPIFHYSPPTAIASPTISATRSVSVGVIAGCILAGIGFLLLCMAMAFCFGKRRGSSAAVKEVAMSTFQPQEVTRGFRISTWSTGSGLDPPKYQPFGPTTPAPLYSAGAAWGS